MKRSKYNNHYWGWAEISNLDIFKQYIATSEYRRKQNYVCINIHINIVAMNHFVCTMFPVVAYCFTPNNKIWFHTNSKLICNCNIQICAPYNDKLEFLP